MLIALAAVLSFLNSFLGLGFLWIGRLGGEALVAAIFFVLAYAVSHHRGKQAVLLFVALPALPLALMITRFRDSNDSHLGSIAIVLLWLSGMVLGALLANRSRYSLKQVSLFVLLASVLHAGLTVAVVLYSFGISMQVFDGQRPPMAAPPAHMLADLLVQPMMSVIAGAGPISRASQWLAMVANSITWGVALVALLLGASGVFRLVRGAKRA